MLEEIYVSKPSLYAVSMFRSTMRSERGFSCKRQVTPLFSFMRVSKLLVPLSAFSAALLEGDSKCYRFGLLGIAAIAEYSLSVFSRFVILRPVFSLVPPHLYFSNFRNQYYSTLSFLPSGIAKRPFQQVWRTQ